ncbi:MAG TPA: YfcE family phosphodiesterase, partial [Microbacterium sp.]|nr:YfcE family phosphodiesterase [Microbacterium sp.]
MPTRLLLVADTHIPGRARHLPAALLRAADAADLIVHAGDWVSEAVLDELLGHGEVIGVYGNNDGDDLRARLPEVARRVVEGVRLAVVHETGPAPR